MASPAAARYRGAVTDPFFHAPSLGELEAVAQQALATIPRELREPAAGVAPMTVQRAVRTAVVPALRALPGVQRAEVYGSGDEALWVQPDIAALRRYRGTSASGRRRRPARPRG